MLIPRKFFTNFNYLSLGSNIQVIQPRRFYSSNWGMSPIIVPNVSYFNADSEKDVAIKQNKGKSGMDKYDKQ